ncbi:MAG: hypothetical protein COA67_11890, partial [Lutibacter sp.]
VTDTSDDPTDGADNDPNNDGDPDDPTVTNLNNPMISLEKIGTIGAADDVNGNGIFGDTGDTITYSFTVTNIGNVDLTGITVSDPLITVVGGPIDLAVGMSDTMTFTGTYTITDADILAGGVTNVATASGTGTDMNGDPIVVTDTSDDPNNTADVDPNNDGEPDDPTVTQLAPISDLELTKVVTDGNYSPIMGNQITFDIIVTNVGPSPATGVDVLDLLPTGYAYVSHTASSGFYMPVTGLWDNLDDMPAGTSQTLTVTAEVLDSGDYNNIAEVMFANEEDPDSPHGNGDLTEDDMDDAVVTPVEPMADLSLVKTIADGNDTPVVGDQITFNIVITNDGTEEATGVTVLEVIEDGYTYVNHSVSSGEYDETTGMWINLDNIPSGAQETLTVTVIVNASGDYTNTAEIMTSDQEDPDSTPGNGVATEDDIDTIDTIIPIPLVDISVTKVIDNLMPISGEEVVFTITVTNDGPSDATGVVVTDALPDGYIFVSADPGVGNTYDDLSGEWSVGDLANGVTEMLTVTAEVLPIGDWTNVAELTGVNELLDVDSDPDNGDVNEDDYAEVTPDVQVILTIPEGFTPDGDGTNEVFEIENLHILYPDFSMEIVNRWGKVVYKYTHNGDPTATPEWWDGHSTGKWTLNDSEIVPTGTYFYAIYFNKDGRKPQSGWIYLRK